MKIQFKFVSIEWKNKISQPIISISVSTDFFSFQKMNFNAELTEEEKKNRNVKRI